MHLFSHRLVWLFFAVAVAALFTDSPAEAFVFRTNYFCSPVKGQILYDGKPVAGVEVVRTLTADGLNNGEYKDTATTDEQGYFSMPEVSNRTFLFRPQFFSAHPGIGQNIDLLHNGEEYNLWATRKTGFELGSEHETDLNEIRLVCELTNHHGKSKRFGNYVVKCLVEGGKKS